MANRLLRWRWHLKAAMASTITHAVDHGLPLLAHRTKRPLVLGYHRVVEDFGTAAREDMPSMLISARMFERHLDCLGRHFRFVTLDEIGEHMLTGRPFDRPSAAITFDDGYRDVYEHAFPVLKRKGIPAGVFVVTGLVGQPFWQVHDRLYRLIAKAFAQWDDPSHELMGILRMLEIPTDWLARNRAAARSPLLAVSSLLPELPLADVRRVMDRIETEVGNGFHAIPRTLNWSELAEMQAAGITIGSHTRSHVSLPAESPADTAEELEGSRRALEERLGRPITHFAYPGGQFTPAVIDAVGRAGYRFAYTACPHGDPKRPALTIERLLLWQGSSVDAAGRFSSEILTCQARHLWPPSRRCGRVHMERRHKIQGPSSKLQLRSQDL